MIMAGICVPAMFLRRINMIIKNAKVFTMDGGKVIERGTVVITNGKISYVGEDVPNTEGHTVIDGEGCILTPGFIDAHTHLGLIEDSLCFEGDDLNEETSPVTPQLSALDGINPFDICFADAYRAGVTSVCTGPGSANPVSGMAVLVKTYGKRVETMAVSSPVSMKFALGENPKCVYHGKSEAPQTRLATAALIKEALVKAKKYASAMAEYQNDPENCDEPEYDDKNEALAPVVNGILPAHFHAHRADDIFTAVRIAKQFSLKYTLVHCTEGYLAAEELAKEGISAILGPNMTDRSKPELKNLSFENPKILNEHGILFSICTDHPETPIQYLPLCAALAHKNGLPYMTALEAITCNAAKILGVSDKIGMIKEGMDGDLVLFDGDPLNIYSDVIKTVINGEVVYEK